jgi:hypothetical protein
MFCIAFEYQGEPHFYNLGLSGSAVKRKQNDILKAQFCQSIGFTLISVPFWWDKQISSLATTINHVRPDIQLHENGNMPPFSEVIPPKQNQNIVYNPIVCNLFG